MTVIKRDGSREPFDQSKIDRLDIFATKGLNVDLALLKEQVQFLIFDGMSTQDIFRAQIKAASGLIGRENPDMTFVAARYLLAETYKRATGGNTYPSMRSVIDRGLAAGRYSRHMLQFDFKKLDDALVPDRDFQFDYIGLQNVVDRYLVRDTSDNVIELPQHFFMRVAMGLAINEDNPTARAIEFYNLLSNFDGMASTPTLFNAGSIRSQLSSCYLNTVNDQISVDDEEIARGVNRFASIYGTIEESARLSKFAGGIGTDWTRVRGAGSRIVSTNGKSSGVIPYLKPYESTAVAVNQGGKRKGSFAPYLEVWHPDFWDFCELKKEFGDDRMRAHDIFPAAWVADLFMERVEEGGLWSTFQPNLYPELHELYGDAFKLRYEQLERAGKFVSQRPAIEVWKHILTNLFETGHPWITFKDECNRRSPQDHVGVVHSSNLCTEITLNTSDDETAVCNLGSVNLARHMVESMGTMVIDTKKVRSTVRTLMRMLDNVIDLNYYPSARAKASNLKHRPVGMGIMGETEAKVIAGIAFDSEAGVQFSDEALEIVSYFAIEASSDLAYERGAYETFPGSKWSRGMLPIYTARDQTSNIFGLATWDILAEKVMRQGMRNSNTMAIAPTATISVICGTTPCNEPIFELERLEGNMSGKFLVLDPCLRHTSDPRLLKTAFEIEPVWVIRSGARRQKWIDQAQSLNVFIRQGTKGRELDSIYKTAWKEGLKTTYYLRSQSKQKAKGEPATPAASALPQPESANFCSIDNPDCEACQ
ncbi:Ribonucleoside-diphosphate reductase 1 subunit alpha [compost metagenome]